MDIYRYILGDIYGCMVEDIQRYILGYIYGYMLGYLQIHNKGCLDIHIILSEIGTGGQIVEHSVKI